MSSLKIVKQSNKVWQHIDSVLGSLIVSKFFFVTENNKFQLVSKGKTLYNSYDIPSSVQVIDETDTGAIETFSSALTLSLRLEQLGYPAFLFEGQIVTISGLIEAGANVTITGLGTEDSPYVISSSGSSFTPSDYDLDEFTNESADPFVRASELPSGSPLVSVTEGENTGIRRAGFNPDNYGDIGQDAVDLSVQNNVSSTSGATGTNSYTEGENTTASEYASHSEGSFTTASGFASHSEGLSTTASGQASHSEGQNNFARSRGEHSGGRFGTDYTPANNGTDRIVNYGNGENASTRSDAFTIFRNGAARFFRATLASITNAASGFLIFDSGNANRPTIHNGTEWKALAYVGEGGGAFIPLTGTEVGSPVTGDIEFEDVEISGEKRIIGRFANSIYEILFLEGAFQLSSYDENNPDIKSTINISPSQTIILTNNIGFDFTTLYGIVGSEFFNKQNIQNAFAQLGDIAETNATATPLTVLELNTAYATQPTGFMVICPNISTIYVKTSLDTWYTVTSDVGAQSINDMATSGSVISFNDFIGNFASGFNDGRFSIQTSGGSVSGSADLLVTPPLGHTLTYSTSTSSAAFITYRGSSIGQAFIANGVDFLTSVRIESLSDATNNNVFKFGVFTDSSTVNISNNGYGFIYNRFDLNDLLVNSANWIVFTKNGASITTFDTGIPVITTEYTKLRLVKSLDNTQVQFYINDILVSTITTNIPAETSAVTPCLVFRKTLGTTAHVMRSDYVGLQINK